MDTILTTALSSPATKGAEEISAERFDEIMRLHQRRVYRVIFLLVRDRDTADTLTQECFLRAYQKRASFRGECRIETWMLRIAVNLVRDHGKSRRTSFWKRLVGLEDGENNGAGAPAISRTGSLRPNVRCWREKNWKRSGTLCPHFRRSNAPFSSCAMKRKCRWRRSRTCCELKIGSVKSQLARATGKLREMKERQWK